MCCCGLDWGWQYGWGGQQDVVSVACRLIWLDNYTPVIIMMARWWQCEGRGLKTCWVSGQWWIFSDQNGLFCFVTNILNVPETRFIISTWLCTPLNIHIWIPVYLWCIHHVYLLSLVKNSVSSLCPTNPGPVTGGNWSLSVVKSWGLLCGADAASSQKYRRIFLGAASGALNVSLFINPQLFLSSPRKKNKKHTHRALAFLSGNILLWP